MKIKNSICIVSLFLTCFVTAQSPLSDTVIQGDLDVQLTSSGDKGRLRVEGDVELATSAASMGAAIKSRTGMATANYWGPVQTGPFTNKIDYHFVPTPESGKSAVGLPLGYFRYFLGAKVTATVWVGGVQETATWDLRGSRHSNVRCMDHLAYGAAKYFVLRGIMSHSQLILELDFAGDQLPYKPDRFTVKTEVDAADDGNQDAVWVDFDRVLHNYPAFPPVDLIKSVVYATYDENAYIQNGWNTATVQKWNGSLYEINGDVILNKVQGDISMGIYE